MPVNNTRRKYDRIARLYDILDLPFEHGRYRPLRRHLFERIDGTVLDAGVGTGRNMAFYPAGAQVVGIDISPAMLARARWRRARLGVDVELHEMDVLRTVFPDGHFDAIVATFLFCVLEEAQQLPALRELARICKPTGSIRLLEYGYSQDPFRRAIMRLWAPWVRWAYGAGFDRNTEGYVPAAGLEIIESRFLFHDIIKLIVARPTSPN
jgi:demethylmenaquinone methyltransferase/2-methoxy-6-polyprenyl-1,4-benzoquinol methylase